MGRRWQREDAAAHVVGMAARRRIPAEDSAPGAKAILVAAVRRRRTGIRCGNSGRRVDVYRRRAGG